MRVVQMLRDQRTNSVQHLETKCKQPSQHMRLGCIEILGQNVSVRIGACDLQHIHADVTGPISFDCNYSVRALFVRGRYFSQDCD